MSIFMLIKVHFTFKSIRVDFFPFLSNWFIVALIDLYLDKTDNLFSDMV